MNPQDRIRNLIPANRQTKKIARNTYARRESDGRIVIKYHATDIITLTPDGVVTATAPGWHTVSTKDRFNTFLSPFGVSQTKGIWYWVRPATPKEAAAGLYRGSGGRFTDGDQIGPRGQLRTQATAAGDLETRKLLRDIGKFAKLCGDALPLNPPGPGDCFYCQMRVVPTAEEKAAAKGPAPVCGKVLGDATGDLSHLLSHMEERYVVPSLVYHAMKEAGATDFLLAEAFGQIPGARGQLGFVRDRVKSAVRRYLKRRFSLAA
jgi:hypothetical protein